MKFKLIKNLTENRMMQDKMWVFDSAIELVNFLKNQKDVFRILYDHKIDKYFVGDAEEYIHYNLLNQAKEEGYYHNLEKFIDQLGVFQNYIDCGIDGTFIKDETTGKEVELAPWLFYIVFDPINKWSLGEDNYWDAFDTSFGSFYVKGCDISDMPELFRLLKKYQEVPA